MKRPVYRGQRGLYSRGAITGRMARPSEAKEPQICGRNIYIYIFTF
jgi:hypothetical protein